MAKRLPRERRTTLHTRNMPTDLKANFKAYCVRRGYSMEAAIRQLMRDAVATDQRLDIPEKERLGKRGAVGS